MSEELKAKITEQALEIARLHKDYDEACEDAMSVARKLPALKAQPGAVALPERLDIPHRDEYKSAVYHAAAVGNAKNWNACLDEVTRLNASRVPEGWQLVPVEPNLKMLGAALMNQVDCVDAIEVIRADYKAMLSAAPVPTVEPAHSKAVLIDRELFDGSEV